jgi:DNA-binding NarL/FixJ family response regulator
MNNEIRIVIADDHPVVRQGLRQMIESDQALKIVAEAGDGQAAMERIRELQPDLAVLDIDMPLMGGFAVAREIRRLKLAVEIVFLTIHCDEELLQAALDLGVKGYTLKDSAVTDIIACVKAASSGRHYIHPALSPYLLNRRESAAALDRQKPGINDLTPTERRILKLIAEEKTSKEIAQELFISPRTVDTHRVNIARKLELRGSLALIKFAISHRSELGDG